MTNRITGIMLAVAHMKPAQIYDDIQSRLRWPYKADTPEQELDIPRIYQVACDSRGVEYVRNGIFLPSFAWVCSTSMRHAPMKGSTSAKS